MEGMHKEMMQPGGMSLPEKLGQHAKMAAAHSATMQEIKAVLDPLSASFNDKQKKLADGLKIVPMGPM